MAVMLSALYKALLEPNEENARKAAEEVAAYDSRFSSFEVKLEKIQGDMNIIKWMMGTLIILTLFLLGKVMTL